MKREAGVFDHYFYFFESGRSNTYTCKYSAFFEKEPDVELVKKAVSSALKLYPEYDVYPLVENNRIMYEKNGTYTRDPSKVKIFGDKGKYVRLGTEDTDGYLFRFILEKEEFTISVYHGLGDYFGTFGFFKTVLREYLLLVGKKPDRDKMVRAKEDMAELEKTDMEDRMDPLRCYVDRSKELVSDFSGEDKKAYIYDGERLDGRKGITYSYDVQCDKDSLKMYMKENGLKTTSLFAVIFSEALRRSMDIGEKDLVFSVPVDCRGMYGSRAVSNFSMGITLRQTYEMSGLSPKEQGKVFNDMLRENINGDNFNSFMVQTGDFIEFIKSGEKTIDDYSKEIFVADGYNKYPVSAISYPGKTDLPGAGDDIKDIYIDVNCVTPLVIAFSYKNKLTMIFRYRYENSDIAKNACAYMNELGIPASFKDNGISDGDKLIVSDLKHCV